MTTHRHSISGKYTSYTNVPIPDVSGLAKQTDLDALAARVAVLEGTTPEPEPTPEPTPVPPPPITSPFPGFAAAESQVAAGGTVNVPAGIYKERFALNKQGVTWNLAAGAVIDLSGLGVPIQQGGVVINGSDIKFIGAGRITGSSGSAIQVEGARVTFTGELDHNVQEGYVWHGDDGLIKGGSNHHNNETGQMWNGSEQGAGKARALRLVIDGTYLHDIGLGGQAASAAGQGFWWDTWSPDAPSTWPRNGGAEVRNCRIDNVWYAGSMFEISDGGKFHHNAVSRCGRAACGWIWGAGTLISCSRNAEVYENTYYRCRNGASVILQGRSDRPGDTTGVSVHNNTFIDTEDIAVGFVTDQPTLAPAMFSVAANNKAFANRFYPGIRVAWNGQVLTSLTQINALPGGGGNVILTQAEMTTALAAAGIA